jgi:hypothetical protein
VYHYERCEIAQNNHGQDPCAGPKSIPSTVIDHDSEHCEPNADERKHAETDEGTSLVVLGGEEAQNTDENERHSGGDEEVYSLHETR